MLMLSSHRFKMDCLAAVALAGFAVFGFKTQAAVYTVLGGSGFPVIPTAIAGFDDDFDDVLLTFEITDTNQSINNVMVALAGNGAGPGNYAILSGATYLTGNGVAPTSVELNIAPPPWGSGSNDFWSATCTFDPPLSYGQRSTTISLKYPLDFIAPFSPESGGIYLFIWFDKDSAASLSLIPATMSEPSVSLSRSNQQVVVTWTGYSLQSSTNLTVWQNVADNTFIGNVTTVFGVSSSSCLYFRAVK